MAILLDSGVLIRHERRGLDFRRYVESRPEEAFYLSVVSASELLHGVHRAVDAAIRTRRSAYVEALLAQLPLLPVDLATARTHAQLWAELAARGTIIGPHDLWLAATAITHGLAIATTNPREFNRVPGLQVEHWD